MARVHDSRVLKNSDIWNPIGPSIPTGYHLLGDGAYPLKTWLLTPYRDNGHLSRVQLCFNNKLSAKRQVIERAFGHLKGRFPRLKFCSCKNIHYTVYTIISACVLHITFCSSRLLVMKSSSMMMMGRVEVHLQITSQHTPLMMLHRRNVLQLQKPFSSHKFALAQNVL